MMPRTGPRRDRVKKQGIVWLAGAGMWIALGAAEVLVPGPAGWVRVTFACCMGLTAFSFIAAYRKDSRRAGNGLSVRGRDDAYGSDRGAVPGWRSAPRLAVMMWAQQALRRARPGPRRPG
jgi:uncharacterized membrane protein YfcA